MRTSSILFFTLLTALTQLTQQTLPVSAGALRSYDDILLARQSGSEVIFNIYVCENKGYLGECKTVSSL